MASIVALPPNEGFITVTRTGNLEPIVYFFADGRSSCLDGNAAGWSAQDIATSLGFGRIVGQSRPYTRQEMWAFRSARNARLAREEEERVEKARLEAIAQQQKWAEYNLKLEAEMDRERAEIRARVLPSAAAEVKHYKKCFACHSVAAYRSERTQHCSVCKTPNRLEKVYV